MRDDLEKFDVKSVPGEVWEALLKYYRGRDLIELIKREPDLQPLTRGYQIATRNADRFRQALREAMARSEQYAAAVYFDWLEDQDDLNEALEELDGDRDEDDDSLALDAKTVKIWLSEGIDKKTIWIYMHCSADRFPADAFALVE